MTRLLAALLPLSLLFSSPVAGQTQHRVLAQQDAPVSIFEYDAEVWGTGTEMGDGVMHDLRFRNVSGRGIVAVKFGLLCYDLFNEFQDEAEVVVRHDLSPGEESRVTHVAMPSQAEAFYTGVAFVTRVRFLNGEVWVADPEEVNALIMAVEEGFWGPSPEGG